MGATPFNTFQGIGEQVMDSVWNWCWLSVQRTVPSVHCAQSSVHCSVHFAGCLCIAAHLLLHCTLSCNAMWNQWTSYSNAPNPSSNPMPLTLREGGSPLRKKFQALKKNVSASPKLSLTQQWCRYWRSILYKYYKYERIKNELKETVWKEHFF